MADREPRNSRSLLGNLSPADRVIRLVLGAVCLAVPMAGWVTGIAGAALLLFAWVPLLTGLVGWCPFYTLLGISTRRR